METEPCREYRDILQNLLFTTFVYDEDTLAQLYLATDGEMARERSNHL